MAVTRCTHLRINGARCTMPAVNGKDLCFEHEYRLARLRAKPALPSTFVTVPLVSFVYPEDHDCILDNVHAISRALGESIINDRTASLMDRLMNTALRTLRQRQKLEKTITSDEIIRHVRLDPDGNPRATETTAEASPAPETPEPTILPALSAEAEEPAEPDQPISSSQSSELRRVVNSRNLSALLSTLAEGRKLERLLSNTYIFRNGKLIVAPLRARAAQPDPHARRATVFLTNMR